MNTINSKRILGSKKKVLIREFNKMKDDYSKYTALKYKEFYENESLSFILENSRYIFSEPMYGCEFYKKIISEATLPFNVLQIESSKLKEYYENFDKMSEEQKKLYSDLDDTITERIHNMEYSDTIYDTMFEFNSSETDREFIHGLYDSLYEYKKTGNKNDLNKLRQFICESDYFNIMDGINIALEAPELYSDMLNVIESTFDTDPDSIEGYKDTSFTVNVVSRMLRDKYMSEKVNKVSNINLRHAIIYISEMSDSDIINSIKDEYIESYNPSFVDSMGAVNKIFENTIRDGFAADVDAEEKINRLLCEKAVFEMATSFAVFDAIYFENSNDYRNALIDSICFESTEISEIPSTAEDRVSFLIEMTNDIDKQISEATNVIESYFSADGSVGAVVGKSIGKFSNDNFSSKDDEEEDLKYHVVHSDRKSLFDDSEKDDDDDDTKDDSNDSDDDSKDDDDEVEFKKRQDAKKRRDDKYANMDIGDFDKIVESVFKEDGEEEDADDNSSVANNTSDEPIIKKPEKKSIFTRIQNKALDTDVKFKKGLSKFKKKKQEVKNAGRAVAKVPNGIANSIEQEVNKWEEMDDNRRKEFLLKPGERKRWFRMLKLAINHYIAFLINPCLNIVLLIMHKFSKTKDERMRNELVRELQTEIKVCEEKIEDAKSKGDNKAKYQLMRTKEKLDAEMARVTTNSKVI